MRSFRAWLGDQFAPRPAAPGDFGRRRGPEAHPRGHHEAGDAAEYEAQNDGALGEQRGERLRTEEISAVDLSVPMFPAPSRPAPVLPGGPRPWKAEEVVDRTRATELIEHQFPALAPAAVEPLGVGWDNTAYVVNGAYVFRFPRREIAVDLLTAESALLPALASWLPVPVPVPRFHGQPSSLYRWPFVGYPLLAGRTACGADLGGQERRAMAGDLGRFLRALHDFPTQQALALGATGDTIGRLDLATRLPRCGAMLDSLRGELEPELESRLRTLALAMTEMDSLLGMAPLALCHGDLYARHLLIDGQSQLAGVIDWGDVHLGHPAVDLAVAHGFLPREAHDEFLRAYGRPVDPETWQLAQFRALFSALSIVTYGRDTGDFDLYREGRQALVHLSTGV